MEEPTLGDILAKALNKQEAQMTATVVLTATHLVNIANFVSDKVGSHQKLECIKQFRHLTGLGLRESRDIMELVWNPPYTSDALILLITAVREEVIRRRGGWNE